MQEKLTVAALQFNIKLGIVDKNLEQAIDGLRHVASEGARLAVLPEMWSAGYDYKRLSSHAAETPRILDDLCRLSDELNLVIVGSLPEKVGDNIYNTATVIDGGKIKGSYRKLHMFSTMGEDRFLSPGDKTLVVPTSVGRIGVAVCYDLRFPEMFRKLALEGAEIICIPAEWPYPRQEHWRTLLRARAIENQLFVVAANCCGQQGKLEFCGMSLVISARGEILAEKEECNAEIVATIDQQEMVTYRKQIQCYTDRRPEIYGKLP